MVATKPVDFRKGAEGLAAQVRETMGTDPFSGAVYVFRAKRGQLPAFCIRFSICDRCPSGSTRLWRSLPCAPL
ncbi:IS66 family insertion sequence element accessory protein TnpB [Mesorhizobium sp. SP-1A]|uniref:IS66 family insertion sequence element accessory protein TnpB n=1 Tax=Mesorhizobium sp. SP-1A TaxID=3077840 RepID=UPI0028F733FF|nr:IS66 family insertion sequence element accessory protein TnpB [Mesorhizobium sp. SP-1A]